MKPTDEELEENAGILSQAAIGIPVPRHEFHRAAALLRACKGRVKVKPLDWRATRFFGDDPVRFEGGPYVVECMGFSGKWKVVVQPADAQVKNGWGYPTFEAAKAAVQADYEARILAAIEQETGHD
jgi:hypothetical protein